MPLIDLDAPPSPAQPPRRPSRRVVLRTALGVAASLALGVSAAPLPPAPVADPAAPAAPAIAAQPARGSFAGRLADSDLTLLVAVDTTGAALAYACDDDGAVALLSGALRAGTLRLDGGGARLHGIASPQRLTGLLTLAGQSYPFDLPPLRSGGLYTNLERTGVWIILDDGSRSGAAQHGQAVRLDRLSRKWGRLANHDRAGLPGPRPG